MAIQMISEFKKIGTEEVILQITKIIVKDIKKGIEFNYKYQDDQRTWETSEEYARRTEEFLNIQIPIILHNMKIFRKKELIIDRNTIIKKLGEIGNMCTYNKVIIINKIKKEELYNLTEIIKQTY
ncbi:MAG: hypothetical protein N2749_06000 [Clostridia bacterium]|nr:hypothetical protein [Clostridia bacterium]